jgi:hypothetical protein
MEVDPYAGKLAEPAMYSTQQRHEWKFQRRP